MVSRSPIYARRMDWFELDRPDAYFCGTIYNGGCQHILRRQVCRTSYQAIFKASKGPRPQMQSLFYSECKRLLNMLHAQSETRQIPDPMDATYGYICNLKIGAQWQTLKTPIVFIPHNLSNSAYHSIHLSFNHEPSTPVVNMKETSQTRIQKWKDVNDLSKITLILNNTSKKIIQHSWIRLSYSANIAQICTWIFYALKVLETTYHAYPRYTISLTISVKKQRNGDVKKFFSIEEMIKPLDLTQKAIM